MGAPTETDLADGTSMRARLRLRLRCFAPAALATALLAPGLLAAGVALAENRPRAVIELFTSQGCASCPPADALLARLAEEEGMMALTMPVDYWDYLGWRDTLAQRAFTQRQKAYSEARGDRKVYTPQIVVNGMLHAVGSDEEAIRRAIVDTRPGKTCLTVPARLSRAPSGLVAEVEAAEPGAPVHAQVLVAVFDKRVQVHIGEGENSGHRGVYHNVVRRLTPIGIWRGEKARLEIPDMPVGEGQGAALLIQSLHAGRPGALVAAAELE